MDDELIKRLRNAAQWADKGLVITPSVCLEAADAIEELICEVADEHNARLDAEERQRWTPVGERLPEIRKVVLITDGVDVGTGWVNQGWWNTSFADIQRDAVTHWMPLPEPPKEG